MLKGYGALEDVPMVVPITLALIVFFSSLTWAIDTVNSTNRRVDMTVATIRISDAFAQWGILTDKEWDLSCNIIKDKEKGIYFSVYLVSPEDLDSFLKKGEAVDLKRCEAPSAETPSKHNKLYVRFFPITYQSKSGADIVDNNVCFLVVMVWPKG